VERPDPTLNWIKDFLKNRTQKVMVNGAGSEWENVTSGIPQGSVLGPILFVIYINDLPDTVESDSYLFADDTKIFRIIKGEDDKEILQDDLAKQSIMTPISFSWVTVSISCPSNFYVLVSSFLLLLIFMCLHFSG
jgi:hypothetical protein